MKIISLLVFAILFIVGFASTAPASKDFLKDAKQFGGKNCKFCHNEAVPKDAKNLNDRGQWLVEQKKKHKAEKVDVSWLKEYKEADKK
jgi:hypothetical protein